MPSPGTAAPVLLALAVALAGCAVDRPSTIDPPSPPTGGIVAGNHFDGSALTGADSWVDVKGNDWQITGNDGMSSPTDGYQTHQIKPGWGDRNTFAGNTGKAIRSGFGFHLAPPLTNRVRCDNQAPGAGSGLANIDCS